MPEKSATEQAWKVYFLLLWDRGRWAVSILISALSLPLLSGAYRERLVRDFHADRGHGILFIVTLGLALISYWLSHVRGLGLIFILPVWIINELAWQAIAVIAIVFLTYSFITGRMRVISIVAILGIALGTVSTRIVKECSNNWARAHCAEYHWRP